MTLNKRFVALALGASLAAWAIAEDENKDDEKPEVLPKVLAVHYHHAKDASSAALAKSILPALHKKYVEREVLFVTVDLTTKGSHYQGRLLLNALGWNDKMEKPGTLAVINANTVMSIGSYTAESELKVIQAVIDKALKPVVDTDDEEDEDDDDDRDNDGGCDSSNADGG